MGGPSGADGLPAPGALLAGKYEVARVLGRGGMGVVVQARHLRMEKDVALKILLPALRDQPEIVARFEREGRAAAQLHGAHVAQVLDVDTLEDGLPFIVMELLLGEDLAEVLHQRGPLPVRDAVGYVLEVCSAMAEAHRAGIVHRDLKPNNLFVDRQGAKPVLKVLDFGISKVTSDVSASMTATATAFGTPLYMSPEQVRSAKSVDGRADIWSLGVVLYELLTGIPPFAAESPTAILAAIIADAPVPVTERRPDLPKPLADAVMRTLEKSPAARFPDVESFAAALAPFGPEGDGAIAIAPPAPARPPAAPGLSLVPAVTASTNVSSQPVATTVPRAPAPSFAPVVMGVLLAFAAGAFIFMAVRRRLPPPVAHVDSAIHASPSPPAPDVTPTPSAVEPVTTATPTVAPVATPPPVAPSLIRPAPTSKPVGPPDHSATASVPRAPEPRPTATPAPRPEPSPERKPEPPPYL
jgi:serine/threonine-protein kinase